jgi:polysaccharide biosynthesis transport protein
LNFMREDWAGGAPGSQAKSFSQGSDVGTVDLRGLLGLLRRRLWLIVVTAGLCLALAAGALYALEPAYTATALILVDPSKKNLLDPEQQMLGSSSDSARVDSEVELVKSEVTLRSVVARLDLIADEEFGVKVGLTDQLLAFLRIAEPRLPSGEEALNQVQAKLRQAVTVQRRGLTFLISVQASSHRPAMAAELANSVAETYITEQLELKRLAIDSFTVVLARGLEDARARFNRADADFDAFLDDNIDEISAAAGTSGLQALYDQLKALESTLEVSGARLTSAQTSLQAGDYDALTQSLQSEALSRLQTQRQELLERLTGSVGGSVDSLELRTQLEQLNAGLDEAAGEALASLRQELTVSQSQLSEVRTQLQNAIVGTTLPSELQTRIFEMLEGAQVARTQYQALLSRQLDVALEAELQVADSRLASRATPPSEPSFPNPRLILLLAGLAGLGLGVGLAFLVENFVGGFTTEEQLQSVLGIPVVAVAPQQRPPKTGVSGREATLADALVSSPLSMFSEAVRRVRMSIDQRLRDRDTGDHKLGAVVMVTSATPGEGKTTVSLSLARAYALSGMSTLLIDCDLRKPSIHRLLGLETTTGLLEFLSQVNDGPELKSIMTIDPGSQAQVLLGSRRSDIPTDQLVGGKTFARLIDAARSNFDVVVLDTPPMGPVVDGLYVAALSDVVVLLVRWASTPQQEVKAALSAVLEATPDGVPVLAVLNQQAAGGSAYRGRYAGYYSAA